MSDEESLEDIRQRKREQLMERESPATEGSDTPAEPIHVSGTDELTEATEQYDVVLVDFYADWCGPCKMLEPVVTDLAADTDAAVAKVDVDANQPLAREYSVQGVPTLILFADGEPVERLVGVQDKDALANTIAQYQ